MCAASDSSASDPASRPATTSTAMKPAMSASATLSQRRSALGRRRVRVPAVGMVVAGVGMLVSVSRVHAADATRRLGPRPRPAGPHAPAPKVVPAVTKLLQSPRVGYREGAYPTALARGRCTALPVRSRTCRVPPPRHALFRALSSPLRSAVRRHGRRRAGSAGAAAMSISAPRTFEAQPLSLRYLDIVLVVARRGPGARARRARARLRGRRRRVDRAATVRRRGREAHRDISTTSVAGWGSASPPRWAASGSWRSRSWSSA